MIYRYANLPSYEDFASGRALYHAPGVTNFPARLASELLGRCLAFAGKQKGVTLYDPLCGAGYLLTVTALLHSEAIARVRGTDADEASVATVRKNLSLLVPGGLEARAQELTDMGERYGRASYAEAAESARRLAGMLPRGGIPVEAFVADTFHLPDDGFRADIILTDLPYGEMKEWVTGGAEGFLAAIKRALNPGGIACVAMDKAQKLFAPEYRRLERQSVGKRRYEIYQLETDGN